ncbi:MAG: hypothetical protein IPQ07_39960 [Myxococcales bacterium]|nr:hypothetical protein [Myxococcales bacterium]
MSAEREAVGRALASVSVPVRWPNEVFDVPAPTSSGEPARFVDVALEQSAVVLSDMEGGRQTVGRVVLSVYAQVGAGDRPVLDLVDELLASFPLSDGGVEFLAGGIAGSAAPVAGYFGRRAEVQFTRFD